MTEKQKNDVLYVCSLIETIARKTDTISYEVLCGVSRRVPRVYLEHGTTTAVEDWILND